MKFSEFRTEGRGQRRMMRGPGGHGGRGGGRRGGPPEGRPEGADRGRGRGGPGRGRRGSRLFDYGELRLLILGLIAEHPSHGYELIKIIEETSGGAYSPSPGVIYPTLTWLEDMGYAVVEQGPTGRKQYSATDEGRSFLEANKAAAEDIKARSVAAEGAQRPSGPPPVVTRALENVRTAMRLRLRAGDLTDEAAQTIADALDTAAREIERS